jgi:hypothetical protein
MAEASPIITIFVDGGECLSSWRPSLVWFGRFGRLSDNSSFDFAVGGGDQDIDVDGYWRSDLTTHGEAIKPK